jgi:hypothetical protein
MRFLKAASAVILPALAAAAILASSPANALDPLTKATDLMPLMMDGGKVTFSVKDYTIETGKYYKWHIEGDGREDFVVLAPDLFRNVWVDKIVMNGANCPTAKCETILYPGGSITGFQADDPSSADIYFIAIRPGEYEFHAKGFESRGLSGKFHVR